MNPVSITWAVFVLGQAGAESVPNGQPLSTQVQSIWDFILKGGPMMIPIGLCSLAVLTVLVERWVSLRRGNIIPKRLLPGLWNVLGEKDDARNKAMAYCNKDNSPLANILAACIKRMGEPVELLEKHIQEAGERQMLRLRKGVRLLAVIASIAPLLGLLGTIFGMITAFQTVAVSGEALGKTELLAKGIYEAMITTAAGLMVAIPSLLGYHWVSAKIEHSVSELDRIAAEFLEEYRQLLDGGGQDAADAVEADKPDDATTGDGAVKVALASA